MDGSEAIDILLGFTEWSVVHQVLKIPDVEVKAWFALKAIPEKQVTCYVILFIY